MTSETIANRDHIDFWAGAHGEKWVRLQKRIDALMRPFGDELMRRLKVARGDHVLDVGCGCGDTSFALADLVGPEGSVTGIDVSTPMLNRARARAATIPELNLAFVEADAQVHAFPANRFDHVFSRFGAMFFDDARAAFSNLLGAAKPGARLGFAGWRRRRDNPWAVLPARLAARYVELPPTPPPNTPGQFGFADADFVRGVLDDAGWSHVDLDPLDMRLPLGADIDSAADFLVEMGPAGAALAEADAATREAVRNELLDMLTAFAEPGGVRMDSGVWIVTAEKA